MNDKTKPKQQLVADETAPPDAGTPPAKPELTISFAKFLETAPPSESVRVSDVFNVKQTTTGAAWYEIAPPQLTLHCTSDICNGPRIFRFTDGERNLSVGREERQTYLPFVCWNCQKVRKIYSLYVSHQDEEWNSSNGHCYKFGELPPFGSPTPNRLLRLFGKDSKIFLKGRQCETHALGIGAFGYYRRVVESHKDQIFNEIIRVTEKIAPDLVAGLEAAKKEHQFLKAVESVKDAIPQGLLINGHNPLSLLHSALSEGLHAQTDEQCLGAAQDVRIVLTALVERLSDALKDEAELNAAIKRLAERKGSS